MPFAAPPTAGQILKPPTLKSDIRTASHYFSPVRYRRGRGRRDDPDHVGASVPLVQQRHKTFPFRTQPKHRPTQNVPSPAAPASSTRLLLSKTLPAAE